MRTAIRSKRDYPMDGASNAPMDILLGPPDEKKGKYSNTVWSESKMEISFLSRSTSSEPKPPLSHSLRLPSTCSFQFPSTRGSQRRPSERHRPHYFLFKDCTYDHPILVTDISDGKLANLQGFEIPMVEASMKQCVSVQSFPWARPSFKCCLTTSIRAIRSTAQSISNFVSPSIPPEDFLTRSFFTSSPKLTKDYHCPRAPPMQIPPSPTLRPCLDPIPMSVANICVLHDQPHKMAAFELQTYRHSRGCDHPRKDLHFTSPKDRYRPNIPDSQISPVSRRRLPRENNGFLRMFVLERNMQRCGKLRDDIPTRAQFTFAPAMSGMTASVRLHRM